MSRLVLLFVLMSAATTIAAESSKPVAIAIHGGAGTITRASMSRELESEYRAALSTALARGHEVLMKGGSSLDAVEAAVRFMEDSPLFNAGKGAVFTHDGRNELDAAIMDGAGKRAGTIAGVSVIKNPISAARAVMEKSPHVMLTGRGAELFATLQGLEIVDPSYFWTEKRWKALQLQLEKEKAPEKHGSADLDDPERKHGTVGAVALDRHGNLAAATSTGGMTNKRWGRVGDVPIIGAGTYASNDSCAVSATGHGEYFIRYTVAHDIAALVEYKGLSLAAASDLVVNKKLKAAGGEGGVIAIDRQGNIAMPFNSEGMYRGYIGVDGKSHVAIFKDVR